MVKLGNIELGECPLILAPMEDITDSPFRSICKRYGANLLITEFISSEGLIREASKSQIKMMFGEDERPIGIQIFGHSIDSMKSSAEIAETHNPDFIDINFGCPVRKVVMRGGGAALLNDLQKMVKMTEMVVRSTKLPVTVKTRLGWDDQHRNIVEIAERLQDAGIRAISIHGRTKVQLYRGKADWTLIGEVKRNPRIKIPVFGNGDVINPVVAKEMRDRYGVDGIMIGRAAVGNPWIFSDTLTYLKNGFLPDRPTIQERVSILKEHIEKSILYKGEKRTLFEIRKFYSGYFKGIPGFRNYRMQLLMAGDLSTVDALLQEITGLYGNAVPPFHEIS